MQTLSKETAFQEAISLLKVCVFAGIASYSTNFRKGLCEFQIIHLRRHAQNLKANRNPTSSPGYFFWYERMAHSAHQKRYAGIEVERNLTYEKYDVNTDLHHSFPLFILIEKVRETYNFVLYLVGNRTFPKFLKSRQDSDHRIMICTPTFKLAFQNFLCFSR